MAGRNPATFTEVEEVEYPFLTEVATPEGEHKVDIVFVHGLNPFGRDDHPTQTWTHKNGAFWPRDFLPQDIPYARIFVYGYNSNVSKASTMSMLGVRHHAEGLLNLLNMERGVEQGQSMSKIVFVGHSLGGLVIKQALVIAHQNPMYTAIRNATFGLVFFGTPHHGAKGIELGKIAAGLAKFVSDGRASNDLLESLEHNSLFTRQVSDQFRHQLEDYQVVTFIEGKPMQMGGFGPLSASKIVVDEQSAVLGLSGLRETQFMLDADHSAMCKIASKSNMYKIIMGNIRGLVSKALVSTQGYIPPPTHSSSSTHSSSPSPFSPPLPPRQQSGNSPYSGPSSSVTVAKVIGTLYQANGTDAKSIRLAELKNMGHWDQVQKLGYEVFQDRQRSLGPDHLSTLNAGYDLACTHAELVLLKEAADWIGWLFNTNKKQDPEHDLLSMKVQSLNGELLQCQGAHRESETVCTKVLTRQQDSLGDNNLDTLDTQRRLATACQSLGRREEAIERLSKRVQALERMVGKTHILFFVSVLDLLEVTLNKYLSERFGVAHLENDVQSASDVILNIHTIMKDTFGPRNPIAIRALTISGVVKIIQGSSTEASDILRRALSYAEELYGPNDPRTIEIVASIGVLYMKQGALDFTTNGSPEMRPWFERYIAWLEVRKGLKHSESRDVLGILALSYMGAQDYVKAETFYEKLAISYEGEDSSEAREARTMLGLCQMNTGSLTRLSRGGKGGGAGSLSALFTGLGLR